MPNTYFVGLRASDEVVDNERPYSWRKGIMELYPSGDTILTGLTALMTQDRIIDVRHGWWEKELITQKAAVTGVYDDASETAYTAAADGTGFSHFWKVSAAELSQFRVGMIVLARDASDHRADFACKVTNVISNGANSFINTQSLQIAPFVASSYGPNTVDTILGIGNANPQGGVRPEAITIAPVERFNYTQIFRNSLDESRTRMQTTYRSNPNAYGVDKMDALLQHGLDMEKSFLWGRRWQGPGRNGKLESHLQGIIPDLQTRGTKGDYSTDTDFSGDSWVTGGDEFIDKNLEEIFRDGSDERLCFAGSGAILGVQRVVKSKGDINITTMQTHWGMKVQVWETPFGAIYIKRHPLFSHEPSNRHQMVIFEPKNIKYKYIQDTIFCPDILYNKGGAEGVDGKQEEYKTEATIEFTFPQTGGILNNVGIDNS